MEDVENKIRKRSQERAAAFASEISGVQQETTPVVREVRQDSKIEQGSEKLSQPAHEADISSQPFTPDDVFWHKSEKAMLADLIEKIKRRSWLDEHKLENAEAVKSIPEIGVDLRAAKIDKMLVEEYNVEPRTKEADPIMAELYEMWAKKWLDYLENQRKLKSTGQTGRVIEAAEPAEQAGPSPRPQPVREQMPVARPANMQEPAPIPRPIQSEVAPEEENLKDMTPEQKQNYDKLMAKIEVRSLGIKLKARYDQAKPEDEKDVMDAKGRYRAMRNWCKDMVKDNNFNLKHFRDNFLKPEIINDYWGEFEKRKAEGKLKDNRDLGKFKAEFLQEIKDYAVKCNYNGEGIKQITGYFNTRISLEHFLKNNNDS